jgi:glycosyltransferase involved in cell wall biosynthesis
VRVCCVASSLAGGGAERVLSLLANAWVARGRAVALLTLADESRDAYALDARVVRLGLNLEVESQTLVSAVLNNLRKVRGLRRAVLSVAPDVVVSFADRVNVLTLFACLGLRIPVIVSERVDPRHHDIGMIWSFMRRIAYRLADRMVVQSEMTRRWAETVTPGRSRVVPNPVGEQFLLEDGDGNGDRKPIVLAVGRLVPQKGLDLLIRAFDVVARSHPDWSLVIIGRGPDETKLRGLAQGLGCRERVAFLGAVQDPERYYRVAELFVLPSRFEGFPNALLEAMACGCAVIAANCVAGPAEIVESGVDGSLVPPEDVGALVMEMGRLMSDRQERRRLGRKATEVSERYRISRILGLWDDVFAEVSR